MVKKKETNEAVELLVDAIFADSKPKRKLAVDTVNFSKIQGGGADYVKFWQGLSTQLISVSEAAKIRGISRISMYELVERGRLHVIEFGGKKFMIRKEVEDFERGKPGPKSDRQEEQS